MFLSLRLPKLVKQLMKMPQESVITLNCRILEGEALLSFLKEEIKQLVSQVKARQIISQIELLRDENRKLENEINLAKSELSRLQAANGVPQIPLPGEEAVKTSGEKPVKEDLKESIPANNQNVSTEIKPAKAPKPKKQVTPVVEEPPVDVGRLDIKVGKILHAQVHPDANTLYIEQIDVGEQISRTVVSGLVKHITLSELDGRMVVVLCNLKPQKMRGIVSEAMVLCASTPETVELLTPPPEARPGDNVTVPGYTRNPDLPFMNPKKKIFEKVADDLMVNDQKQASYKGVPWQVEGREGFITVQALSGCHIR